MCYLPDRYMDAVIVAAGSSQRFGDQDKLFAPLAGRPVLAWSMAAFEACKDVERLVVVTSEVNRRRVTELAAEWAPRTCHSTVLGGARRRDSVEAGLHSCISRYVAIHDGARPLLTPALITRVGAAAQDGPGAIAAMPVTDSIKQVRDHRITGHPERSTLWAAQTPQVVLRTAWLDAARMSDNDETDDAAMLSRLGLECAVVESDASNLKITRPADLIVAETLLRERETR